MWEQYGAPGDDSKPTAREAPLSMSEEFGGVGRSGAVQSSGGGPGMVIGMGVFVICLFISIAVILSAQNSASEDSDHSDYSDWYQCIAEEEADDPGLLSPADLCEIGHERPPGYVDTYEYDPFGDNGY